MQSNRQFVAEQAPTYLLPLSVRLIKYYVLLAIMTMVIFLVGASNL